ncbi:hypothetical protein CRG98_025758 [Punica granatum]|uniref:Glycerol-3-phosphate acyltransferase RAM2/GPAT1-8 HAD-like domain-containing protein n=1 Tax=Punica granatum TaxID=22663 RepID=A0A2I0JCY4_PUNGR|nr:hypothetical protein CRG98_025758 [Punica granatum]
MGDRLGQTVASDLEGTLLLSRSPFPYFFLVALEAGSPIRALALLLAFPVIHVLNLFQSCESMAIKIYIFISFAGLKIRDIELVSRAVLPKFYADDVHPETWRVFSSYEKRYVISVCPRVMLEPFAKAFLGADKVIVTDLEVSRSRRATGFVKKPGGVLVGWRRREALEEEFGVEGLDLGLVNNDQYGCDFMSMCKLFQFSTNRHLAINAVKPTLKESYMISRATNWEPLPRNKFHSRVIFHDGRLVQRPTPSTAVLIFLWLPIGVLLSILRIYLIICLPHRIHLLGCRLLGIRIMSRGRLEAHQQPLHSGGRRSVLFVCNHRTVQDPIALSIVLGRKVTAVTYGISRFSELISPIRTVSLLRERDKDAGYKLSLADSARGSPASRPRGSSTHQARWLNFPTDLSPNPLSLFLFFKENKGRGGGRPSRGLPHQPSTPQASCPSPTTSPKGSTTGKGLPSRSASVPIWSSS